jgi:hypothetical protein
MSDVFSAGSGQQEGAGDVAVCVCSITASHPYFTSFLLRGSCSCNYRFGTVERLIMHKVFIVSQGKKN